MAIIWPTVTLSASPTPHIPPIDCKHHAHLTLNTTQNQWSSTLFTSRDWVHYCEEHECKDRAHALKCYWQNSFWSRFNSCVVRSLFFFFFIMHNYAHKLDIAVHNSPKPIWVHYFQWSSLLIHDNIQCSTYLACGTFQVFHSSNRTHIHTSSRSQFTIHQNPLEFITSSGLHYWFPVYPQLSAHVITPVIDFSKLDVIRRELMQTFTLLSSKIRAYLLNIEHSTLFAFWWKEIWLPSA